jgi:hypothetical protein
MIGIVPPSIALVEKVNQKCVSAPELLIVGRIVAADK